MKPVKTPLPTEFPGAMCVLGSTAKESSHHILTTLYQPWGSYMQVAPLLE